MGGCSLQQERSVRHRRQVLKLLINYTHRRFARFCRLVMDMVTHVPVISIPTKIRVVLRVGRAHARMPPQVWRVSLYLVLRSCVVACFYSLHVWWQLWSRVRMAVVAPQRVACSKPLLFFESSLACSPSFLRSLCFIVFVDNRNELHRRYCSLGSCLRFVLPLRGLFL